MAASRCKMLNNLNRGPDKEYAIQTITTVAKLVSETPTSFELTISPQYSVSAWGVVRLFVAHDTQNPLHHLHHRYR